MTVNSTQIDLNELGERLRIARESAGVTQAEAAKSIKVARTTLVAVEQGLRRIRTDELQGLAQLYKVSANALLRQEAVHVDLVPRFRKLIENEAPVVSAAVHRLNDLVRAEVELENILGVPRVKNYPPERPIMPGDVRLQAEQDAQELRQWLGIGLRPVVDIINLLELQLGVRVYQQPLDSSVSGLFAYDEKVGACILLNANHRSERRTQSAAHELGHFISTRKAPELLEKNERETSREERYAGAFARAFVTPARPVMQQFKEITAGSSHLTRRHVIVLAHAFGVSREALVRRLEELALVKSGTWEWFVSNGGITDEHVQQVLGDVAGRSITANRDGELPISLRLNLLVSEAWKQELLSEGQLCDLLKLDRISVRKILDAVDMEKNEGEEIVKLSS